MVGHTGDFAATVQACEVVDGCLGRVVDAASAAGGAVLITADHGNAEHKIDPATNEPLTAHTTNPVPVVLIGSAGRRRCATAAGSATSLPPCSQVMGLPQPEEMTGPQPDRRLSGGRPPRPEGGVAGSAPGAGQGEVGAGLADGGAG